MCRHRKLFISLVFFLSATDCGMKMSPGQVVKRHSLTTIQTVKRKPGGAPLTPRCRHTYGCPENSPRAARRCGVRAPACPSARPALKQVHPSKHTLHRCAFIISGVRRMIRPHATFPIAWIPVETAGFLLRKYTNSGECVCDVCVMCVSADSRASVRHSLSALQKTRKELVLEKLREQLIKAKRFTVKT